MLEESMKNPKFREDWEAANAELAEVDALISARSAAGMTQSGCDDCDAETVEEKQCKSFPSETMQTSSKR